MTCVNRQATLTGAIYKATDRRRRTLFRTACSDISLLCRHQHVGVSAYLC